MNERCNDAASSMRVRTTTTTTPLQDIPLQHASQTRALMPGLRRKSSIHRPPSKFYCLRYFFFVSSSRDAESTSVLRNGAPWIKVLAFVSLLLVNAYLLQSYDVVAVPSHDLYAHGRQLRGLLLEDAEGGGASIQRPVAIDPKEEATTLNRTHLIDVLDDLDDDDGGGAEQWKEDLEDTRDFLDEVLVMKKQQ